MGLRAAAGVLPNSRCPHKSWEAGAIFGVPCELRSFLRREIEISMARWAGCHPLQSVGTPGIPANLRPAENTDQEISGENHLRGHHPDCTDRDELVHRLQVGKCLVMVGIGKPAGKADGPEYVHQVKGPVEEDEGQEEVHLAPALVHHPPKHLGEQVVGSCEDPEYGRHAHDHVKVGDHKIGIV